MWDGAFWVNFHPALAPFWNNNAHVTVCVLILWSLITVNHIDHLLSKSWCP